MHEFECFYIKKCCFGPLFTLAILRDLRKSVISTVSKSAFCGRYLANMPIFLTFEVFINWITTPKSQKIHYFSTSLMRFASKTVLEILFRNLKNIHLPLIMCHQNHKFSSKNHQKSDISKTPMPPYRVLKKHKFQIINFS